MASYRLVLSQYVFVVDATARTRMGDLPTWIRRISAERPERPESKDFSLPLANFASLLCLLIERSGSRDDILGTVTP
jgi:hypothetical protein